MMAAVDNDVLVKGLSYGLLFDLLGSITSDVRDIGMLGAARFVVRASLRKANLNQGTETAFRVFEELLGRVAVLEPTNEETTFAAELEFAAQRANFDLDTGESQLCAIVIGRALPWLATGDKRAVRAFEQLLIARSDATKLAGKVLCLEQLFLRLIGMTNAAAVRGAVCAEPSVDVALALCFGCHSAEVDPNSWSDGLKSYIADLRREANTVLAE